MAQSLSFTDGGNITTEDIGEWKEKLSHVLDTSVPGHKFRIYLELKQVNTLLRNTKKQPQHTRLEPKYLELEAW
jgi:hypothetical protein